jgi:FAD/FMN-containing dehydrogenase
VLDEATIEQSRVSLRGELIQPSDPGYDEARKIYNGMIDKRPRMIAHCSDVADVISCVNFARENDVLLAVRGGGHNGAGWAVVDDGLVIDLSGMKGVRVDLQERTVRVEGGATWGEVDHATHAFGLAVPTGIVSTTGVAGLTLGGGHTATSLASTASPSITFSKLMWFWPTAASSRPGRRKTRISSGP